jgi:hypothetical protein
MANKNDNPGAQVKSNYPGADYYQFEKDYQSDLSIHDNYITEWDGNEAMLISKTYDAVSKQTKNGITDGDAATMIIERSARVVGQLPEGEIVAAGKKDKGKALFMDILRQKWIYPNANAQRPLLDKIRLWEMYSGVYGEVPMYYDWDVSPSGYVGPNCWLWNPRNFIPQQGRFTITDMDYVHAISYMGYEEIKDLLEQEDDESDSDGWNRENLQILLEVAKNTSKSQDSKRDSYVERQRNSSDIKDRIQVVTRYESGPDGRWVTFAPDFASLQLRDIANPHKNGKIPFVIKPAIPLMDSFYNLSDMSRAKPIQFAKDGLTNFYFQGIKMNIYPPTVVNAQGILRHTVSNEPGAIWEEIIENSARRLETSTAGLATYQAAMGQMSGALQNVFGTTTTQMNADTAMNPQFGKTPEALKYQQGRESARDNQNRALLQSAVEQLMDGMMSLIPAMGTEGIPVDLFTDDIKEIQDAGYTDVGELFTTNEATASFTVNESQQSARLIINPVALQGIEYRFNMEPDSTIKTDKEQTRQNLKEVMDTLGNNANVLQEMLKTMNKVPNWPALLEAYVALADLPIKEVFIDSQPQPEEHPVMKLIETLNIKFESLPEDSKCIILEMIGAPTQQASPTQQDQNLKAADVFTKAVVAGHQMRTAEEQHGNAQHDLNLKTAKAYTDAVSTGHQIATGRDQSILNSMKMEQEANASKQPDNK